MRKFKKGDKVIATENKGYIKEGTVYTVISIGFQATTGYPLITILDIDGYEREYYEYRFKRYNNKKNHLPVWF